jgi:hypothetical protein
MMDILLTLTPYLAPLLAGVLTILLTIGAKKLLDKVGVDRSQKIDDMIDRYITVGVDFANVWATKKAAENTPVTGESKKAKAIKVVMDELTQSGVTGVAEELLTARIESWLLTKGEKPGEPTGESA